MHSSGLTGLGQEFVGKGKRPFTKIWLLTRGMRRREATRRGTRHPVSVAARPGITGFGQVDIDGNRIFAQTCCKDAL